MNKIAKLFLWVIFGRHLYRPPFHRHDEGAKFIHGSWIKIQSLDAVTIFVSLFCIYKRESTAQARKRAHFAPLTTQKSHQTENRCLISWLLISRSRRPIDQSEYALLSGLPAGLLCDSCHGNTAEMTSFSCKKDSECSVVYIHLYMTFFGKWLLNIRSPVECLDKNLQGG